MLNRATLFSSDPERSARFGLSLSDDDLKQPESQRVKNESGNTPLHYAIRNCINPNDVTIFLDKIGKHAAATMAKTVNDKGQLPIDLVSTLTLSPDDKQALYILLTPSLVTNELKHFSTLIDSGEVLKRYPCQPGSEMYKNLQIACSVVNESRKAIIQSSTHPEINDCYKDEKMFLDNKIQAIRRWRFFDELTTIVTHPIDMLLDTQNTINQKMAERPIKESIGNCGELAFVAWYFLRKQDKKVTADFYHIKNGDHAFIIIGKGNNAVVCDAWAGEVYPTYAIPDQLRDYRRYPTDNGSFFNVVTFYNPKFHTARPDYTLKIDNLLYKLLIAGLGMFTLSGVLNALTTNAGSTDSQMALR